MEICCTLQKLMAVATLLSLAIPSSAQLRRRCINQMALANQACFMMHLDGDAPMLSDAEAQPHGVGGEHWHGLSHGHEDGHGPRGGQNLTEGRHGRGHGHSHGDDHGPGHSHEDRHGRRREQSHEDGHEQGHGDRRGHGHGHSHGGGHGHRRRQGHRQRDVHGQGEDCCRWLKEVDAVCVCNVLLRLPTFLTKPKHAYSVAVADNCNVTYSCGGI